MIFRKIEFLFKIKVLTRWINQTGWEMVIIADHVDSMVIGNNDYLDGIKAHKRYARINSVLTEYRDMYQRYLERDYPCKSGKNGGVRG